MHEAFCSRLNLHQPKSCLPRSSTASAPFRPTSCSCLDDYHAIEARDIQDGIVFLLDHLPPKLHVVIAPGGITAILVNEQLGF